MRFLWLILLWGLTSVAQADIYRRIDADGVMHFTNAPIPGDKRFQRVLKIPIRPLAATIPRVVRAHGPISPRLLGGQFTAEIDQLATELQIDPALIRAVVQIESASDPTAVSNKGAMGLMQLMPATAKRYGVADPFDPAQNLRGGARYLRDLLTMFNNDIELALAAYNAGEQSVIRFGHRIPPFAETIHYVPKVLSVYRRLRGEVM